MYPWRPIRRKDNEVVAAAVWCTIISMWDRGKSSVNYVVRGGRRVTLRGRKSGGNSGLIIQDCRRALRGKTVLLA